MSQKRLDKLKASAYDISDDIAKDGGGHLWCLAEEVFDLGVQYGWLLNQMRVRQSLLATPPHDVLQACNSVLEKKF